MKIGKLLMKLLENILGMIALMVYIILALAPYILFGLFVWACFHFAIKWW